MRIANVIEEGKLGGPQVRMVRVATALADRAETLIVLPRANSDRFREMCETHGVPYRVLPLTRVTKEWREALAYLLFSPWEVLGLARLFRRERIDLVHASGGSWQYKAVIAARLAGVPVVWHLNDTSMPYWVRRLFRLVQPLANGFIYSSESVLDYYGRDITGDRASAIVPPPVSLTEFDPCNTFHVDDKSIEKLGDGIVIGTIGNINQIKGIETLIRAAGSIRDRGLEVHIVIVGPVFERQRGYHARLTELVRQIGLNNVLFVGGRSDVRPVLKRMDIYVCPSRSESWGMALWEAMAMARPVISTDVGDISRHVIDGQSGYVVPVGDAEALAERLLTLIHNPEARERMGQAARNLAGHFTPPIVAEKTFALYRQVLRETQGHADDMRNWAKESNGFSR